MMSIIATPLLLSRARRKPHCREVELPKHFHAARGNTHHTTPLQCLTPAIILDHWYTCPIPGYNFQPFDNPLVSSPCQSIHSIHFIHSIHSMLLYLLLFSVFLRRSEVLWNEVQPARGLATAGTRYTAASARSTAAKPCGTAV